MPEAMTDLAVAIRAGRRAKNLTQAELGAHFGVSKSAVNMWESGRNAPDPRKFAKLVRLLDLDLFAALRLEQPSS